MGWKELTVIILVIAIIASIVSLTVVGHESQIGKILRVLILVLFILLLLYIIYEIYQYFTKVRKNSPLLFDGPFSGKQPATFPASLMPPSGVGNEYTYSFWIYIKNWDYQYDNAKHILSRGSNPTDTSDNFTCNPGIWLYPKSSNLMIRFDTHNREDNFIYRPGENLGGSPVMTVEDSTIQGCQQKCRENTNCGGFEYNKNNHLCTLKDSRIPLDHTGTTCNSDDQCGAHPQTDAKSYCQNGVCTTNYDTYIKTKSMNPNVGDLRYENTNEICDLVEIPIQRWVHLSIVMWNRTTDIYLNGKLVRSCILKGIPKVPWDSDLHVSNNDGFDGALAQLRYFNRALNASEIYKLYSKGPLHWNLLKEFSDLFPKVEITTTSTYGGTDQGV